LDAHKKSTSARHLRSIISVTSYSAILSQPDSPPNKYGRDRKRSSSSGGTWFGFFFKIFIFAGIVAGGYYGWQEYQRRQRYNGLGSGLGGAYGMRTPGVTDGFGGIYPKKF